MGVGYHGGFGSTYGSNKTYKLGYTKQGIKLYTREELIDSITGITKTSTKIAEMISNKIVGLNILGDRLFSYAFGLGPDILAFYSNGQIYIRSSSSSILDDLVHEGKHAFDNLMLNKSIGFIQSKHGELRAYSAEREFQMAAGRKPTFENLNDIIKHIKTKYK